MDSFSEILVIYIPKDYLVVITNILIDWINN